MNYTDLLTSGMLGDRYVDPRRQISRQLYKSGTATSPIAHPMQGYARLAQTLAGMYGDKMMFDERGRTMDAWNIKQPESFRPGDVENDEVLLERFMNDPGAQAWLASLSEDGTVEGGIKTFQDSTPKPQMYDAVGANQLPGLEGLNLAARAPIPQAGEREKKWEGLPGLEPDIQSYTGQEVPSGHFASGAADPANFQPKMTGYGGSLEESDVGPYAETEFDPVELFETLQAQSRGPDVSTQMSDIDWKIQQLLAQGNPGSRNLAMRLQMMKLDTDTAAALKKSDRDYAAGIKRGDRDYAAGIKRGDREFATSQADILHGRGRLGMSPEQIIDEERKAEAKLTAADLKFERGRMGRSPAQQEEYKKDLEKALEGKKTLATQKHEFNKIIENIKQGNKSNYYISTTERGQMLIDKRTGTATLLGVDEQGNIRPIGTPFTVDGYNQGQPIIQPDSMVPPPGLGEPEKPISPLLSPSASPGLKAEIKAAERAAGLSADLIRDKPKVLSLLRDAVHKSKDMDMWIKKATTLAREWEATGLPGLIAGAMPFETASSNLTEYLTTIKANLGFDKLQQMREISTTGGALGQVSEMENELLQAVNGALNPKNQEQLLENLAIVRNLYPRVLQEKMQAYFDTYGEEFTPYGPDATALNPDITLQQEKLELMKKIEALENKKAGR